MKPSPCCRAHWNVHNELVLKILKNREHGKFSIFRVFFDVWKMGENIDFWNLYIRCHESNRLKFCMSMLLLVLRITAKRILEKVEFWKFYKNYKIFGNFQKNSKNWKKSYFPIFLRTFEFTLLCSMVNCMLMQNFRKYN